MITLPEAIRIAEEMAFQGKDYDEIKRKLKPKLRKEEDIKRMLRAADDAIVQYELAKQVRGQFLTMLLSGFLIFSLGVGITLYTYFTVYFNEVVLAYGAIIVGFGLLVRGFFGYITPLQELAPRRTLFSHKRKYERM